MGAWVLALGLGLGAACGVEESQTPRRWSQVLDVPQAALLGVHGSPEAGVWAVGADDGSGPEVLHDDGDGLRSLDTGTRGDLWWAHAAPGGVVYLGGAGGTVLRHEEGAFEALKTPGSESDTVYGLWAPKADQLYAVGSGPAGRDGFAWFLDDGDWRSLTLPDGGMDAPGLFKVWGTGPDDVWLVGSEGRVLRGSARDGFEVVAAPTKATLFTVHANAGRVVMVGGDAGGVLLEWEGDALVDRTPEGAPLLQGVSVDAEGVAWAVGLAGSIYRSVGQGEPFEPVDPGFDVSAGGVLHAAWAEADGEVWAVGGNVLSPQLDGGLVLHYGE